MVTKANNQYLTEDQIERAVEREMNMLDRLLMSNAMTQKQYDQEVKDLDYWAKEKYKYTRNRK